MLLSDMHSSCGFWQISQRQGFCQLWGKKAEVLETSSELYVLCRQNKLKVSEWASSE